ncbi:Peptidase_S8 domain-containing protein [Trichoderma simmonsii]|uniref:Peptidase_S8 domain-containing protein n=1 Tax=Trichoderma simmonsii TaxID=1491479 RepID=A0A8G0L6J6_9HYPO|nr:Peptidase_S8 domain-containing protein [Trichoderma simmonsii]
MLERFKNEVKKYTEKLEIKIIPRIAGLFSKEDLNERSNDVTGSKEEGEQQHIWVKRMEQFRTALNSIHKGFPGMKVQEPNRVKVALIDDGVDLSALDIYDGIVKATGQSYCYPDNRGESPWHRSSNGHGTIMANMIVRINPWVSLYVMKLQDGPSIDGGRYIFAESAAKAIRGAIQRNVDIISMSWTIKQKIATNSSNVSSRRTLSPSERYPKSTLETNGLKLLEEAIEAAVEAKILMFCSASDDIQDGGMDCLPYQKAPHHIFRIGAALSQGQRDPHSEDKGNMDYFFPGNQVAEAWNPRSAQTVKYHNGSSVSTALSAGFASLIIYCVIIMRTYYESKPGVNDTNYIRFRDFAEALKDRDKMKMAFDSIEYKGWDDRKYLPVWGYFGTATEEINKAKSGEEKVEQLGRLAMQLCGKLNMS